jgi:hypothetical protein|tara:strand:- start:166 stop:423 length:258 start_codon:yes stop_codon:yes gene_type:complete
MYRYKLNEKTPTKSQGAKRYQQERLRAFDDITDLMARLKVLLDDARVETETYYNQNPDSFRVVYATDLTKEYIGDVMELFKQDGE